MNYADVSNSRSTAFSLDTSEQNFINREIAISSNTSLTMQKDNHLNILEQRPNWARLTTNVAWCFATPDPVDIAAIVQTLQRALDTLTTHFPWTGGQVINEGAGSSQNDTGVYKFAPLNHKPQIITKDLRLSPSAPCMQKLRSAGFAIDLLDEDIFAPRSTLALKPGEVNAVLLMQATFIQGGMVLVFSGNHSAMDMPGQAQVIHWFNRACNGEAYTADELEIGNMPRRDLIPLLNPSCEPSHELLQQTVPSPPTKPQPVPTPPQPVQCKWSTLLIPSSSVSSLKVFALATLPPETPYISTDDALSAFLWQSIARARLPRLQNETEHPSATSTTARAINVRRVLDLPPTYPGLAQNTLYHTTPIQTLCTLPLGEIAALLRSTLSSPILERSTLSLATALSRTANKSQYKIAARMDMSTDILLTSHLSMRAYEHDFNLGLGRAEAVRLTKLVAFEGLVYLLPRNGEGGDVAVAVCLREGDERRLKRDVGLEERGVRWVG